METQEQTMILEGPATFLDVVYETIDAHLDRTGDEYEQVITGVGTEAAGDVDYDDEAVLHLYILGGIAPDDAREWVDRALDRIADEHDMNLARQSVQAWFEDETKEEI